MEQLHTLGRVRLMWVADFYFSAIGRFYHLKWPECYTDIEKKKSGKKIDLSESGKIKNFIKIPQKN